MKHILFHVILPIAIIAGANAFDWKTTSDSIHRGNIEKSSAWMIGKHPSNLKITLAGISMFSFESWQYLHNEKEPNKKLKIIFNSAIAYQEINHVQAGIHNDFLERTKAYHE